MEETMIRCEKCGSTIQDVSVEFFDHNGRDNYEPIPVTECEYPEDEVDGGGVYIDVDKNWTGYELDEEELSETIKCPHCGEYPFSNREIQVYDIVRVVMFKKVGVSKLRQEGGNDEQRGLKYE